MTYLQRTQKPTQTLAQNAPMLVSARVHDPARVEPVLYSGAVRNPPKGASALKEQ